MIKSEHIKTVIIGEYGVTVNDVFYALSDYDNEFFKELMYRIRISSDKRVSKK